jgi:hypothetical protein
MEYITGYKVNDYQAEESPLFIKPPEFCHKQNKQRDNFPKAFISNEFDK